MFYMMEYMEKFSEIGILYNKIMTQSYFSYN